MITMSKHIVMLSRERELDQDKRLLKDAIDRTDSTFKLWSPRTIGMTLHADSKTAAFYNPSGEILNLPDVLFAFSTLGQQRSVGMIVQILNHLGVQIFDGADRYWKTDTTKCFAQIDRWALGCAPETSFAFYRETAGVMLSAATFPIVMKPVDGRHGRGVVLCDNIRKAREVAESLFNAVTEDVPIMWQQYVKRVHEYRVIMIDGKAVACARKSDRDGMFENQIAYGGGMYLPTPHQNPILFAEAKYGNTKGLFGIDVLWGENNRYYILEANRAPTGWKILLDQIGFNIGEALVEAALAE